MNCAVMRGRLRAGNLLSNTSSHHAIHPLPPSSCASDLQHAAFAEAEQPEVNPVAQLETRVSNLENRISGLDSDLKRTVKDAGPGGFVIFLFGAFCALWAQNTGRSAWLWFFLGAVP